MVSGPLLPLSHAMLEMRARASSTDGCVTNTKSAPANVDGHGCSRGVVRCLSSMAACLAARSRSAAMLMSALERGGAARA